METGLLAILFGLGLVGGTLSGLLGIGGGIIMFPLLLYIPVLAGYESLSIKAAASITSVQSFFGALSGAIGHHKHKRVNKPLALYFGGSMSITSLIGSIASKYIAAELIIMLFAAMAVIAAVLMLTKKPIDEKSTIDVFAGEITFKKSTTLLWGSSLGLLAGIIGQGGGFLFVPVMLHILHIPLRVAIGTALVIGLASSTSVLIGRATTLQIPLLYSVITVFGAILGAQFGAHISQFTPKKHLKTILSVIIIVTAIKMVYELII